MQSQIFIWQMPTTISLSKCCFGESHFFQVPLSDWSHLFLLFYSRQLYSGWPDAFSAERPAFIHLFHSSDRTRRMIQPLGLHFCGTVFIGLGEPLYLASIHNCAQLDPPERSQLRQAAAAEQESVSRSQVELRAEALVAGSRHIAMYLRQLTSILFKF